MPIPTQTDMFRIVLDLMQDGKKRTRKEISQLVAEQYELTDAERAEKTSSGQAIYVSRASWAVSYLERAGYLDRISRGVYRTNEAGLEVGKSDLRGSAFYGRLQKRIAEMNPWNIGSAEDHSEDSSSSTSTIDPEKSPEEQMGLLANDLDAALSEELLELILDHTPDFFEQLVVDLLEKMGYGQGKTTQYIGDSGIDGIVTTDALGFDPILTQAKRYAPEHRVGRPEIQAFAGALGSVTRGVFITTSTFTSEAVAWAKQYPHATLVLIDGKRLTRLMISYDLGVYTERMYRVKRIDSDYFES